MTPQKMLAVITAHEERIHTYAKPRFTLSAMVINPLEAKPRDMLQGLGHALRLCKMIRDGIKDPLFNSKTEMPEYMRQLGCIEAILWVHGLESMQGLHKTRR
jgi:uncharacterized membrane protein YebE (DUF533 family)